MVTNSSESRLEQVYEYSTSAVLPLYIRKYGSEQPIDDIHMSPVCGGTTYQMWTVSHHCQLRPTTRKGKRNDPGCGAPSSPLSGVVIRLGGFHLLLSLMGSIGGIMAGSDLEKMWETV